MKYNTAVSSLMILLNEYEKLETISKKDYRTLLTLLNPIAPHITEELNKITNLGNPICESQWVKYDVNKLESNTFEMIVQVNGKVRGKMTVSTDTTNAQMEMLAKEIENVQKHIEGKEIVKVITIPKKMVNIVIK